MKISRLLFLGGIAGPVLFAIVILVVGALRPDYSHVTQFISELGENGSAYSDLMNYFGFMCSAGLIMLFAIALLARVDRTTLSGLAAILIGLYAIGMFLAGVYSCDSGCLVPEPSREQVLHNLVSFAAFLSLILATVLWGIDMRKDRAWQRFGNYSLVTAGLAVVLIVSMIAAAGARAGAGMYQRLFLTTLFLWMAMFAYRLWREDAK